MQSRRVRFAMPCDPPDSPKSTSAAVPSVTITWVCPPAPRLRPIPLPPVYYISYPIIKIHALLASGAIVYDAVARSFVIDNLYATEAELRASMSMEATTSPKHELDVWFYVDGRTWAAKFPASGTHHPLTVRDVLDAIHLNVQHRFLQRVGQRVERPTYSVRTNGLHLELPQAYRWRVKLDCDLRDGKFKVSLTPH